MKVHVSQLWRDIFRSLGTFILACIMGLIAWLIVIDLANPLQTRYYPDALNIEARGLAPGLMPIQALSQETVRIQLRAPELRWPNINADDINVFVDLSGYAAGAYELPIQVETASTDLEVMNVDRRVLRVQLDEVMTKTVAVQATVMDSAEYGYSWETPVVEPVTVTVTGPAQKVSQVVSAEAPVFLRGATTQVERLQTVNLLNRLGQVVENVSARPTTVDISIPIERWPGRRTVAVRVKLEGEPALGYRLVRVTPDPSNIVLYGDATALDQVPGYIETAPLSLDGAITDIRARLDLLLPDGVNASEGNSVTVNAEILPIEGGRTITLRPFVRGLTENLEADFSPETVDVIISGPQTSLSSLESDDILVTLDVNGLSPGSYSITPNVIGPSEIRAEGSLPETVEVVITSTLTDTEFLGGGTIPPFVLTPTGEFEATPAVTETRTITTAVTTPVTPTVSESLEN